MRLAALLAGAGILVAACGPKAIITGEHAREFSLPPLANADQRITLHDYAHKPMVISFFASWSPTSEATVRLLAEFYRQHPGVVILGVDARDSASAARALLRQTGVTYPVAADTDLAAAHRFHVPGVPATYFLDARHKITETVLGPLSWQLLSRGVHAMDHGHEVRQPRGSD
jgi:peroxiredoxin